jgi:hypothetical protein
VVTAGVINNSGGGGELQWRQTAVVADCSGTVRWRTAAAAAADCCGGGVLRGRRAVWAATVACGVARVGGEAVADGEMIMITLL